jgi:D-psicose/D-tagatose/L-ribulose 3-epimerase
MTQPAGLRVALCNEVLRGYPFPQQCALAAQTGYAGLELAPFTLADDPFELTPEDGRRLRGIAADHGLLLPSLHWLLAAPEGLSIATPDAALHARSVRLLEILIRFAAACGATWLVHGSPRQRAPIAGQSVADAQARCEAAWAQLAPTAAAHGVVLCIEALSPAETPVINTVAQAAAVVDRIASPAVRTMLDLSAAAASESDPPAQVLAHHLRSGHIAHVQLNDRNRRGPGQGSTAVAPVLGVLREHRYAGWVSIEPFEYHPTPETCAAFSLGHVQGAWQALAAAAPPGATR